MEMVIRITAGLFVIFLSVILYFFTIYRPATVRERTKEVRKMEKIKIFEVEASGFNWSARLEREVNSWFIKNPNIKIVKRKIFGVSNRGGSTVSLIIFYEAKPKV